MRSTFGCILIDFLCCRGEPRLHWSLVGATQLLCCLSHCPVPPCHPVQLSARLAMSPQPPMPAEPPVLLQSPAWHTAAQTEGSAGGSPGWLGAGRALACVCWHSYQNIFMGQVTLTPVSPPSSQAVLSSVKPKDMTNLKCH